ncbi:hypothetical protein [Amycolatopsis benzoatilytica]|uniref:hypothetical protein n=1 Tax=Amycolatopsis benzoatilytica TaxID=346045 RepID=UPI00036A7AA2|nr:hypothetical protein [Amycolatopsis benzoatilytica]
MSMPQGYPPLPAAPVRRRAHLPTGAAAAALAGCTAIALVWFVFANVLIGGTFDRWSGAVWLNVVSGLVSALVLVVPAGFLLARHRWAAWTLFGLCLVCLVGIVAVPMPPGTSFGHHLDFVLGFHKSNGVPIGLAAIFAFLTAIAAAVSATVRPSGR